MPVSEAIPEDARQQLADCRCITTLPIQWGDQDAFGHVNNVVYFRWFESARIDLLDGFGPAVAMSGPGPRPILASIRCDYRRQLHYPDTIHIGSFVSRIGRTSVDIGYRIYSEGLKAIAAEGTSVIVVFDYHNNRPVRVPEELRAQLETALVPGGDHHQRRHKSAAVE
ncbi:MAG: acyl-CoA thioesterase [Planctomycetaceae bacterium]|nr:acyl-CoA thioesterase [Planctomycetaceae bacterium]